MKKIPEPKLSIVISGWPAVGKTTMAIELAKEFGLKSYSGGDILKMFAENKGYSTSGEDWWDTKEAKRFMQERKSDPSFDKLVDKKLIELIRSENAVITSYTLPWLVDGVIKFWLKGSQENRANRMANRDNIPLIGGQKCFTIYEMRRIRIFIKIYTALILEKT